LISSGIWSQKKINLETATLHLKVSWKLFRTLMSFQRLMEECLKARIEKGQKFNYFETNAQLYFYGIDKCHNFFLCFCKML